MVYVVYRGFRVVRLRASEGLLYVLGSDLEYMWLRVYVVMGSSELQASMRCS